MQEFKRGDIWLAEIPFTGGSVQYGKKIMVICSNDIANLHSPVLHGVPLTSQKKPYLPTHTEIFTSSGLYKNSTALGEQVMPLPKSYYKERIGCCDEKTMKRVDICLGIHLGLIKLEKRDSCASA